ncbi:MAG: acetolactate decarboxylase [Rhodospirillaceae bacterium]
MITLYRLLAALMLSGAAPALAEEAHVLYQTSIINALLQGVYDGATTIGDLHKHGDFGIGTINGLDGELIGLEGRFYQIRSDGTVHLLDDDVRVPFATVIEFEAQQHVNLPGARDFTGLGAALDARLASVNTVVAVRIHGQFPWLKVRSVPRQTPPYRPLAQVVEGQSVFEFVNLPGTLVGFRTPEYMRGLNVPGWHLHFLSDDGDHGGHVLDLRLEPVIADLDYAEKVEVALPRDGAFRGAGLGGDMKEALHKVEQGGR